MKHFIETEFKKKKEILLNLDKNDIMNWFMFCGYYGDKYKYPPVFQVSSFNKSQNDFLSIKKKYEELLNLEINYSKNKKRLFSLMHPNLYYNVVKIIVDNWETIIKHIYNEKLRIFSYSFPVAYKYSNDNDNDFQTTSYDDVINFMILEKNIIDYISNYKYILKLDISKCYPSIYTHSISWAFNGREKAYEDKDEHEKFENKLDFYLRKANHYQTNGIPIGSATSDIISEIILSKIDLSVSLDDSLKDVNFIGTRYKDDYRILCNTEEEATLIKDTLIFYLKEYNLWINESKTFISKLPKGLERKWKRLYNQFCKFKTDNITEEDFLNAYYSLIDIEEEYPETLVISKFLSSIIKNNKESIISNFTFKEKIRVINLLYLLVDYSPKILPEILGIIEILKEEFQNESEIEDFNNFIVAFIKNEYNSIINSVKKDEYKLIWLYFFAKKHNIELEDFDTENKFFNYMKNKKEIFDDVDKNIIIYNEDNYNISIFEYINLFDTSKYINSNNIINNDDDEGYPF